MPNSIKIYSSQDTTCLKKGNFSIATGDVSKGPTSLTGFYNGLSPVSGGWTIYHRRSTTQNFGIYTPSNDSDLLNFLPQVISRVKNYSPTLTSWAVRRSDITLITDGSISGPFSGASVWQCVVNTTTYANTLHRSWNLGSQNGIIHTLGSGYYRYYLWVRGKSTNSLTAAISIDISDGSLANKSLTVGTSTTWTLVETWDKGGTYNADKFFDFEFNTVSNGDTFYISSIVIASSDTSDTNKSGLMSNNPGYIAPLGTILATFSNTTDALTHISGYQDVLVINFDYEPIITSGLVLHYDSRYRPSFPGTNSTLYDLSTHSNHATLVNEPGWDSSTGDIIFDGSNDHLSTLDNASLDFGTGDFTVLCWVGGVSTYPGNAKSIIWKGSRFDGNLAGWSITWAGSPQDLYFIISSDSQRLEGRAVPSFGLSAWSGYKMIGMQRSGTTWIQINNGATTSLGTFAGNVDNTQPIYIARNGHYNSYLNSLVHKVQVYSRALSRDELLQNYYMDQTQKDGLVWSLDASNPVSYPKVGTIWYPLTGGFTGSISGAAYINDNRGIFLFDGTDDRIDFGTLSHFDYANFTVGIWAKSPTNTSGQTGFPIHVTNLVGKGNWNGNNSWRIGYKSSGSNPATFLTFGYGITWSSGPELSVGSFDLSQWNYFVGVATPTQHLLYLNGTLRDTKNLGKTSVVNTDPLQLGRASYTDRFFSGNIAMVHIYNSALSSGDILQNYGATKWRFGL
jgi:hypothetical protein